ncbi:hypothetical protein PC110_g12626 [Phytophthora cactorum]|uniref:C2 domain-containing protein n=1 Tax=Phytophthora cactorum TaxID=29920 RepID=A0A329S249_9STRA|nr:hypothetical protein PC110_g12626 [Phytophthora cactorum]
MGMELHVRACSARNLLDKQTFGKQDPYCKLQLRGKSFKTRVHDNGHKTPVWNEVFVFSVVDPQLDQLVIEVKDKNFTSSTLIGECRLPVSMFLSGSVVDQWYTLNNGSKRAGEVNLRVQFKGPGVQPAGAAPMASTEKGGSPYGHHHHHHGSPRGYGGGGYGGGGYGGGYGGGGSRGGGMSTGQMAMGVGAGVLGGMLLGEALDDVFD